MINDSYCLSFNNAEAHKVSGMEIEYCHINRPGCFSDETRVFRRLAAYKIIHTSQVLRIRD